MLFGMRWSHTLALLALSVSVCGFGKLAEEVLEGELRHFDQVGLAVVQSVQGPALTVVAVALSLLGAAPGSFLVASFAFWFLWKRRRLDGGILVVLMMGATVLVVALKSFFRVDRPSEVLSTLPAAGYSFPSGHALIAICLYGYLAYLALESRAWGLAFVLAAMVIAIDWSRLYLLVHWPSDVLAGSLVGGTWLALCLIGRRREAA